VLDDSGRDSDVMGKDIMAINGFRRLSALSWAASSVYI
jgi:hypothetical protein